MYFKDEIPMAVEFTELGEYINGRFTKEEKHQLESNTEDYFQKSKFVYKEIENINTKIKNLSSYIEKHKKRIGIELNFDNKTNSFQITK